MTDTAEATKADYERMRDLIKHEDTLLGARIKSLFTFQVALFAVFGFVWDHPSYPLWPVYTSGILCAVSYGAEIALSCLALGRLTAAWNAQIKVHPDPTPIVGLEVSPSYSWLLPGNIIAVVFLVLWICLAFHAPPIKQDVSPTPTISKSK